MIPEKELYKQAGKQWDQESQLDMVIEECAELINSIEKWRRERVPRVVVIEEAVDVEICLNQLRQILDDTSYYEYIKRQKLIRLENLLKYPRPGASIKAHE